MNYIGCFFSKKSGSLDTQVAMDILVAELGQAGFESFTEHGEGVDAYIQKSEWDPALLDDIQILRSEEVSFEYEIREIEQVNWNEEWEKNFEPIVVEGKVSVRAPFHEPPGLPYDIVIEPKMSFGTGHHETTYLMVQHLLEMEVKGRRVLDMGCGTGILAIFAAMKGAEHVDAIDIDNWCYVNSLENVARNRCESIEVFEGDAELIGDRRYDIIIANINRNILLNDMSVYAAAMNEESSLLLSGFYTEDIDMINEAALANGLKLDKKLVKNNWVGLKYVN